MAPLKELWCLSSEAASCIEELILLCIKINGIKVSTALSPNESQFQFLHLQTGFYLPFSPPKGFHQALFCFSDFVSVP